MKRHDRRSAIPMKHISEYGNDKPYSIIAHRIGRVLVEEREAKRAKLFDPPKRKPVTLPKFSWDK